MSRAAGLIEWDVGPAKEAQDLMFLLLKLYHYYNMSARGKWRALMGEPSTERVAGVGRLRCSHACVVRPAPVETRWHLKRFC